MRVSWRICVTAWFAVASPLLSVCCMPSAEACSVPVFRWALERWPADDYELIVFRDAPLPMADAATLQGLAQRARDEAANLRVRDIDVTQSIDEAYATLWTQAQGGALPACFLLYPQGVRAPAPAWSGVWNDLPVASLLDSPARRELARRLLDGQSGVWLLLLSGDPAQDEAAGRLLSDQIDQANKTLALPDMAGDEVLEGPDAPDISNLRVEFSLLPVRRDDPAERALVLMLLGTEPDLSGYQEVMAFPVYGRGQVLYALVGKGINPITARKAHTFLVGPCACEIKAENPGTDLLLPVDWEAAIGDSMISDAVDLPPLPGTALPEQILSCAIREREPETDGRDGAPPLLRNAALVVVAAALLVAAATLVSLARRTDNK